MTWLPEDSPSDFPFTCHYGLDHATKQHSDDLLFLKIGMTFAPIMKSPLSWILTAT